MVAQGLRMLLGREYAAHVVGGGRAPGELKVHMRWPAAIFLFISYVADDVAVPQGVTGSFSDERIAGEVAV